MQRYSSYAARKEVRTNMHERRLFLLYLSVGGMHGQQQGKRVYRRPMGSAPFAIEGDEPVTAAEPVNPLAGPFSEKHTKSHFVLGGPDQVSHHDIMDARERAQAGRHAGRRQESSILLQDDVPSPRPPPRNHGGKATQSSVQLTDEPTDGVPQGYMYNVHGKLARMRPHAQGAARGQMHPTHFGAPSEERPPPAGGGRAAVPTSRAQRTLCDAIMYGPGGHSEAEASLAAEDAAQCSGRRHCRGHAPQVHHALQWRIDEEPTPAADAPAAYGGPAYGGPAYGGPAYGGPAYGGRLSFFFSFSRSSRIFSSLALANC